MKAPVRRVILGAVVLLMLGGMALAQSGNGSATEMPAFYDGRLFTVNRMELPPDAEEAALAQRQLNQIYHATGFISVLSAIQGDEFNPLWNEVDIEFVTVAPRQFTSDEEILDTAAAGHIRLNQTRMVFRCAVVGTKR
jgi:hypothetical protein